MAGDRKMKKAKPVILMDSFRDIREAKKRPKSNIGLLGASRANMRVGINKGPENYGKAIRRLKFAIINHCRAWGVLG